ncbi:MAG: serine/threonine protein kinase [Myxococcales bacterium]|nr:serine/threonine protein kinase [Myxococcales bacterium]
MFVCTTCKREFPEHGYCPFDGALLSQNTTETHVEKRTGGSTDDRATHPLRTTGHLSRSAVANVLRGVLEERQTGQDSLVGVELDGRYRIEKLIGEGGMGMVYLARHIVIEKRVAIKILREEVAADESVAKRFVQEARAASRIGHPNIIDVTDFGTTKTGLTYQVMEFLEGRTLTELIATVTPLPIKRALGVIAQMARALGAAHAKGIVHRDLKPDNIFLVKRDGREDFVKIVDFGIAKVPPRENSHEARLTQVGTVFGTPEYMSPEQASGRTDVDSRADIYAVGIVLYEMIVGRVPHKGETTVRTLSMQILDDPPTPSEVHPQLGVGVDLENVVMRALQKDRAKRFQTMQELLDGLEVATSKTELDLPLLLRQERISAKQAIQEQYDTMPEIATEGAPLILQESTSARDVERSAHTSASPRTRRKSRVTDPVFLRQRGTSSSPIEDPIEHEETAPIGQSNRKLGIVLLALLLVGGSVSAFVLTRNKDDKEPLAAARFDASQATVASAPVDANPAKVPPDASVLVLEPDAQASEHRNSPPPKPREGPRVRTTPNSEVPLAKGYVEVTIITRPHGARLVIDKEYAGSDGLNISRKAGTTETVLCRLNGHKDGSVVVRFDGKREVFLCKLRAIRTKRCVDGVKNPFDDCP